MMRLFSDTEYLDDVVDGADTREAAPQKKTEKLLLRDSLRGSASYLMACEALKGTDVCDEYYHLCFNMSSLFDVKCAIAALDYEIELLEDSFENSLSRDDVPWCVRTKYKVFLNVANAYHLAVDDFYLLRKLKDRLA